MRRKPTTSQNSMISQLWQILCSAMPLFSLQAYEDNYAHKKDDDAKAIVAVKRMPSTRANLQMIQLEKDYATRLRELGAGLAPMLPMLIGLALLHQTAAYGGFPTNWGGGYFDDGLSKYEYRFQPPSRYIGDQMSEQIWDRIEAGDHGLQVIGGKAIRGLTFNEVANVTCGRLIGHLSSLLIQANHTLVNFTGAQWVVDQMAIEQEDLCPPPLPSKPLPLYILLPITIIPSVLMLAITLYACISANCEGRSSKCCGKFKDRLFKLTKSKNKSAEPPLLDTRTRNYQSGYASDV